MSRRRQVTGRQMVKALQRAGFMVMRSKGSHHFLRHPDGRTTVVPIHAGETLGLGLHHKILKDVEMDAAVFEELL
jgi:predicted RNA binding protein YcfA (HicA-like mRNA interferase family)